MNTKQPTATNHNKVCGSRGAHYWHLYPPSH